MIPSTLTSDATAQRWHVIGNRLWTECKFPSGVQFCQSVNVLNLRAVILNEPCLCYSMGHGQHMASKGEILLPLCRQPPPERSRGFGSRSSSVMAGFIARQGECLSFIKRTETLVHVPTRMDLESITLRERSQTPWDTCDWAQLQELPRAGNPLKAENTMAVSGIQEKGETGKKLIDRQGFYFRGDEIFWSQTVVDAQRISKAI